MSRFHLFRVFNFLCLASSVLCLVSCNGPFKNDYNDNSPTSGKLKVYYDEGLALHVKNQTATFESQYKNATIELFQSSEAEAVQALYNDSCEAIVISRLLTTSEKRAFDSKHYSPKYTAVAKSGVAIIANINTGINSLSYEQVISVLSKPYTFKDSSGKEQTLTVLFDKNNSAVLHYMMDSVLKQNRFSSNCSILNSSLESINYVAKTKNSIAFIDFAWLSDSDDSVYKANEDKIKFLSVSKPKSALYELPNQSSFKLGTYAFTRTVYVMRKTGEFSLAKGFESFIAGPKGQLTFLKQGLLPTRQGERALHINMEDDADKNH